MTVAVIAERADVPRSVIYRISGRMRGFKRTRRVRPATESAILAVRPDVPPVVKVDEANVREAYGLNFEAVPAGLDQTWRAQARCRAPEVPTWFFFPNRGDIETSKLAQQFCQSCPVKAPCLDFALKTRALGIWGGKTEIQRQQMRGIRQGHGQSA